MSGFGNDALAYELNAERLLTVDSPTPQAVAEAQAWATLALSNRTAEATEKLATRLDTLDGTLGVGFSGIS